jgi:hypothetical protein
MQSEPSNSSEIWKFSVQLAELELLHFLRWALIWYDVQEIFSVKKDQCNLVLIPHVWFRDQYNGNRFLEDCLV